MWVLNFSFKFKLQWERVYFKLNNYKREIKPKKVKPITKSSDIVVYTSKATDNVSGLLRVEDL